MANVSFEESQDLKDLAHEIIEKYHPHLKDALDVIGFYFREGNADWLGKAKKCTAFERHTTGYNLFVFINSAMYRLLTEEQKKALMDHELCHFSRQYHEEPDPNNKGKWIIVYEDKYEPDSWKIADHDVEEFSQIIERHGLWDKNIEKFAEAIRNSDYQMTLSDVEYEQRIQRVK